MKRKCGFSEWIATPAMCLVAVLVAAGSPIRADERPNIILISVDTLRADHLGCYGYSRPTTPFLDSLARRGVRFSNAFCQASWTLPSHVSLLTSLYPCHHTVQTAKQRLPANLPTLAESLRRNGYSTTAFISWVYVSEKYGLGRGFDAYHELLPPEDKISQSTTASIKAAAFVDKVIEWIGTSPRRPFFLFLHLFDPHINYEPPKPYDTMFGSEYQGNADGTFGYLKPFIRDIQLEPKRIAPQDLERVVALYDGEIRYTDDQLKRLFEALDAAGLLENTLVVFTSDHGEEHDDHGSMEGHQWHLYDEVLRVPLIMRFPKDRHAGITVEALTQSIDVAPTILNDIGVPVPEDFEGRDLNPAIEGEVGESDDRLVYSEIKRFNEKWAVRSRDYKLIFTKDIGKNRRGIPVKPGYELYDLVNDPKEQRNIYDPELPPARELQTHLDAWVAKGMETQPAEEEEPQLTSEELKRLKSLGYVE